VRRGGPRWRWRDAVCLVCAGCVLLCAALPSQAHERELQLRLTPQLQWGHRCMGQGLQASFEVDRSDLFGWSSWLEVAQFGRQRTPRPGHPQQSWQHRVQSMGAAVGAHLNPLAALPPSRFGDALLLQLAAGFGLGLEHWGNTQQLFGDAWVADRPASWHRLGFVQAQAALGWRLTDLWTVHSQVGWRLPSEGPSDWRLGAGLGLIFFP
jgi:hypothetical protein